jgi:UDP-N-acetylmuramate--alanine ligase
MSAIAEVLHEMGHAITGSDMKASSGLSRLRQMGLRVWVGHSVAHVGDAEAVVASSAVPASNVELTAAQSGGVSILSRSDILAAIATTRRIVAVAGTHGKTTSASMLALTMGQAGLHPSFLIGGELNEFGTGAVWVDSDWLVVEADESDGTFLALTPEVGVVTSIEPDHIEYYGSLVSLEQAYDDFLGNVRAHAVVCADYPVAAQMARSHGATTYGVDPSAEWRIVDVSGDGIATSFELEHWGTRTKRFNLPVPGLLNVRNATAAIVAGLYAGVDIESARRALARFAGVARRFQFRGSKGGVTFVDDYAHLPGEIEAVIDAAAQGSWRRIVCVFQPHRYSRTETLWPTFGDSFSRADVVVIMDVYPAGEPPRLGISGALVADVIKDAHPDADVTYLPVRSDVLVALRERLREGDLCLILGAGDVGSLIDDLLGGTST